MSFLGAVCPRLGLRSVVNEKSPQFITTVYQPLNPITHKRKAASPWRRYRFPELLMFFLGTATRAK
nr:MAG TPA: hypothetical protein [Caudoviricetes sp.]